MPKAGVEAERLLEDLGLVDLPVDPVVVCEAMSSRTYQISVEEKPLTSNTFHGISMGDDRRAAILINSSIQNRHRRRFTAAHEVGHVHLHIQTQIQSEFQCSADDISSGDRSNNKLEKEANEFASSLLMPAFSVSNMIKRSDLSWDLVETIRKLCDVSLEAASRRVVALSNEICCLIVHKNGEMWTPIKSRKFDAYLPIQDFPNHLDKSAESNGKLPLPKTMEECNFDDWSFLKKAQVGKLNYSAIHNSEHNRTMTLLLLEEADEWEDEEEFVEPYF